MRSYLIIGCGYLGERVARAWQSQGHAVTALTRSPQRGEVFRQAGIVPIVGDLVRPDSLPPFPPVDGVLIAAAPDRAAGTTPAELYVAGLRHVLARLSPDTGRVVYASSTGVFGQNDGSWVDESSPCRPERDSGRAVLAAEHLLLAHPLGERSIRLRLAGLYGPGRIPRRADLAAGRPMAATGGFLNLIHVDDATRVVLAAAVADVRLPSVYLVADGSPVRRVDYFRELARLLEAPEPIFAGAPPDSRRAERSSSDKRVRNGKMRRELVDPLRYPSFREGLAAIVAAEKGAESESQ